MKWTSAVVLAASLLGASAKMSHTELMKHAVKATRGVPSLREKEAKRKLTFKTKMETLAQPKKRSLQNNNNGGGYYNYYGGNNADADGGDDQGYDYQQGYWYGNDYNYQWNEEMEEEDFGFDISAYAIKYTGCHTVETYNENLAGNDQFETVLGSQRYATFRLCPADTCNVNNKWGCNENYGEYVVPLDNYVESIVGYGEQRVQAYCQFCEDCAAREAYRAFARNQINQMQYDVDMAEELYEQFKENMKKQQAYNNAGDGGYYMADDDMYDDDEDDATYMVSYYQKISNAQKNYNYNNQNGNGNYNYNQYQQGQDPKNSYNYWNQNMWKFSNSNNQNQNQGNAQQQNQEQVNQDYWSNMGQFANFNGHNIFPGYFSNQGEFVADWGYFYQGEWVSLDQQQIVWDENQYGEVPEAWENYIGVDPDEIEQCEYEYSSNCYQSYETCMMYKAQEAADDDWYPDWYQQDYDENQQNSQNYKANQNYQYYVEQQQQKQENQFLAMTGEMFACHQVVYEPEYDGQYNENYQQQQYNNAQMYMMNKYMEAQLEMCGDDEACIYDIETQMQQNQEFTEWLAEYNEKLYDQYINGEKMFFIGASCDEDGGISLKVYNDEDCSYEDQNLTAEKVLGFDITDYMGYDLIPDTCIPCDSEGQMQDQFYFGEDDQEDEYGEEGITPMCSMLYQIAGKCNENLAPENLFNGYYQDGEYVENNYDSMYQSYAQQQNQDLVCSFIESLNSGTYDQSGQVFLDNSRWGSPAKWQQGIAEASRNMPGGLKAALFLTALAAALMGVWACMLHGALARKNIPWQPKRAAALGGDPVDMARQNSGIVMGRSRSGPVTHPLI